MNVSVVICAYTLDRWDDLSVAVRSCLDQSLTPHEVIVVVDHNEELLAMAARDFDGVQVTSNRSTKGLSGARNSGVATATGEIVAFLDDDAYAEPQWLERLVAPMVDETVAGVGGWVVPHWPGDAPQWFPKTFYWVLGCSYSGLPANNASIRNPIGASMAMRREIFSTVGGFTSGIGRIGRNPLGCEETELCIRYSARRPDDRFVLRRDAIVHHRVPASRLTWSYFWRRCWAEGLSKAAVTSLVGAVDGLASERRHAARAIPKELVQAVASVARRPRDGVIRLTLIAAGSVVAAVGFLRGRMALRKSPLQPTGDIEGWFKDSRGDSS